jgi:hypothetical protein
VAEDQRRAIRENGASTIDVDQERVTGSVAEGAIHTPKDTSC